MGSKVPNNCIVIETAKTHNVLNYRLKAVLNRCVLSENLKLLIDLLCLISLGSLFQSLGAALQNALSPYLL